MTPPGGLSDWLPAPPPYPPFPRILLFGRAQEELFKDYIAEIERALERPLTEPEKAKEWELWRTTLTERVDEGPESLPQTEGPGTVKGTWARGRGMYAQTVQRPRHPPTRDQVRVEVWEERDRLHIGIQNKETGEYIVSWWDDEARQMFEHGFFRRGRGLEESVLLYAQQQGLLAPSGSYPQLLPQAERAAPPGLDSELEALAAQKRREWEARGYHPGLIQKAMTMAREWPAGLLAGPLYTAIRGTPTEREVAKGLYRMGFEVADRWIESMSRS